MHLLVVILVLFLKISISFSLLNVPDSTSDSCRRVGNVNGTCYTLKNNYCFGVKLPYSSSSSELVNPNFSQLQIQTELQRWEGLRNLPKCWQVIQPLLCAIFMPKCQDGIIELPSQELCKVTRSPCRIVEHALKEWPDYLKCDDPTRFPPNCKNTEIRELRFNTSSKCLDPMISVESSFNYYEGFEGCGLKCKNPLFTDEQHDYLSNLIFYGSTVSFIATGLVIMTYIMDWKSAQGYPSVIIFYVNLCYCIATVGWMIQFLPNAKEDIVCRKDATIRRNELNAGENVFCVLVFVLIYFGSMAALAWLVVFAYVWDLTCNAVGRIRERVDRQSIYFHALSWLFAVVLTAISVSLGKVDGSSMSGICFLGYSDSNPRIFLLLLPLSLSFLTMSYYLWKGFYRLVSVLLYSPQLLPPSAHAQLKSNALRIFGFLVVGTILMGSSIGLEGQELRRRGEWETALRNSLICKLNLTYADDCGMSEKPGLTFVSLNILMFFAGGILVSSWAWTPASVRTWKRSLAKWWNCRGGGGGRDDRNDGEIRGISKHRLIAQAYAKRAEVCANGRLSLSLCQSGEDPIGLNRMLDPVRLCGEGEEGGEGGSGGDISSEWAAALPHLITRRGGIVPPHSSNSVSCVSEDNSRRRSCDSAMSDFGRKGFRNSNSDLEDRGSKRNRRRNWFRMKRKPFRGGSSSSLESNGTPMILPAITALIDRKLGHSNFVRTRESGVQTSLEKLPISSSRHDEGTEVGKSLLNLNGIKEIGTQTKKSATKKREKRRNENNGEPVLKRSKNSKNNSGGGEGDPVLKLLT